MRGRPAAFVSLLLLAAAAPAPAQESPAEQARGLLEEGRGYRAKKQYKQALDSFTTIVSGFSGTDSVDDALLEIGRYYLEVEGNVDKAREKFDEVAKRYPQSDGAPGAYYYLGLLTLNRATSAAELDDALAQLGRIQRLYPRSEWVPRALYASARVHRKAGRLPDAVESARRAALEYPTSDVAAAAQFEIGHCLALQGEPRAAMEEYQRVRNRFAGSEWAELALYRITALYRLFGSGRPAFNADAAYTVAGGDVLKEVRAILMTPSRTLWIASDKVKSAVPYEADGKRGTGITAEDLRSLTLSPKAELVVGAQTAVRIGARDIKSFAAPGDKPGVMEALEKIEAAAVMQGGHLLVADEKRKHVFRYDGDKYVGTFPDSKERHVRRIVVDGEGGVLLLDDDEKTLRVYDEAGRALRALGPRGTGWEFKRPTDVAVDPFRNLYVADEEHGVMIFAPSGQLMATLGGTELKKPRAIALDVEGGVLVYDAGAERILRYR